MESLLSLLRMHWDHGPAGSGVGATASWTAPVLRRCCIHRVGKAPEDWRSPRPCGPWDGSWKASFRFCACIGTMDRLGAAWARQRLGLRQSSGAVAFTGLVKRQRTGAVQDLAALGTVHGKPPFAFAHALGPWTGWERRGRDSVLDCASPLAL